MINEMLTLHVKISAMVTVVFKCLQAHPRTRVLADALPYPHTHTRPHVHARACSCTRAYTKEFNNHAYALARARTQTHMPARTESIFQPR